MPWAMLGEVVDEADLATGERREGISPFLRKLAGALAVFLALGLLDLQRAPEPLRSGRPAKARRRRSARLQSARPDQRTLSVKLPPPVPPSTTM